MKRVTRTAKREREKKKEEAEEELFELPLLDRSEELLVFEVFEELSLEFEVLEVLEELSPG